MNLSGKDCLITGASSGLGLAVANRFAQMGARTVLLCRNEEKGRKAVEAIAGSTPDADVELMICDLASLDSLYRFIDEFRQSREKLDILFNNAAVMKKERTITDDGFETMFQVNYLAPFVLMNELSSALNSSTLRQIINPSRPSAKLRVDFDDLQFEKKYRMYGSFFLTKLYLMFASQEFSRRHPDGGITVINMDPGAFKSDLVRDVPLANWFKNLISISVEEAADSVAYVSTSDEVEQRSGLVFVKKKARPLPDYWQDAAVGERLWNITESLLESRPG